MDLYLNFKKDDNNILFYSLLHDNYDKFVEHLFDYSSLLNNTTDHKETLLHYACFYGMIDKFYALINMGAKIEKTKSGNSLLHYACLTGKDNFLIVELVKADFSPIEPNNKGETPLHYCANEKIAHYLNLWCQRNNTYIPLLVDYQGNHVLHTAKKLNHGDTAQYWLRNYPEMDNMTNDTHQTWKDLNFDATIEYIWK